MTYHIKESTQLDVYIYRKMAKNIYIINLITLSWELNSLTSETTLNLVITYNNYPLVNGIGFITAYRENLCFIWMSSLRDILLKTSSHRSINLLYLQLSVA